MSSTSVDSEPSAPRPPLRLFTTLLHLAVLGTLGWGVISTLITVFATGLALAFVFGIGIILLIGLVYALFGVAWFEMARVNGLYRLGLSPLTMVPTVPAKTGASPRSSSVLAQWLRRLGRQSLDGRMWRALSHFAIACIMGTALIPLIQAFFTAVGLLFAPLGFHGNVVMFFGFETTPVGAVIAGSITMLLSAAVILGLAVLHRTLSLAIIGTESREAALKERAHDADQQAQQSAERRVSAVRAAEVERTRIERDLHDGVQPRLVSVGMTLGLAQQTIDSDPATAKDLIAEAHTSTKAAITELRQLARGIHASVLDDRGLDAALSALAGRSHIPVTLDVRLNGRLPRDVESAVYFTIAESLTNAAKHSRANECRVQLRLRPAAGSDAPVKLWARVEDDGVGGATVQPGGGLDGISNRVIAAGGTIRIDSPHGGPTSVEVEIPCAS